MHLLLTDRLHCPRCGPGHGLILLANRLADRRVRSGALGCSNCRDRFPIEDGAADLRPPPRTPLRTAPPAAPPEAQATAQLAALLGVTEGPGWIGLAGPLAAHADALADLLAPTAEVEVVAVDPAVLGMAEREGVSRAVVGFSLPFTPWTFRALAIRGGLFPVEELLPLVQRGGRVVVEAPADGEAEALERGGVRLLLRQGDWIVGTKESA